MRHCPFLSYLYYICLPTSRILQPVSFYLANRTIDLPDFGCRVPKEAIRTSNVLTASLFFTAVFGDGKAVTALGVLVVISTFGNILTDTIGSSRIIRECGRCVYLSSFRIRRSLFVIDKASCLSPSFGRRRSLSTHLLDLTSSSGFSPQSLLSRHRLEMHSTLVCPAISIKMHIITELM